jgi:hypothetical protein
MSDSDKSSNSENKNSFWTTFPGVLTAVGAFLVAITGLITALQSMGIVKKLPTQPPIASSPTPANQAPTSTQSPPLSSQASVSQVPTSTQSPIASSPTSVDRQPSTSKASTSTQSPTTSSDSTSKASTSTQSPTPSSDSTSKASTSTPSPTTSSDLSVSKSSTISSSETSSSKPSAFFAKTSSVPKITIDSLKEKPEVKSSENIAGQLTGEVPSEESLWLYVYDTNSQKYHYYPISVSGESWKTEDSVVFGESDRAADSQFKVGVVLADSEVTKQLKNEPKELTSQLGKLISEEIAVNLAN